MNCILLSNILKYLTLDGLCAQVQTIHIIYLYIVLIYLLQNIIHTSNCLHLFEEPVNSLETLS